MVDRLVRATELTTEEKASITSGASFWETEAVQRVGIPSIYLTDGPHGVRKQSQGGDHLGIGDSVPATCFPPAVALGSSWDAELLERVGRALGEEAKAEGVGVLLGPGINIKRSPLCGRNFEYLSEDPIVSGRLGSALVRGLQSQGVGASLKHFAANNQETDRMRVSADVDERPLREIYLRGFQRVVQDAQPWTVMCSYNRINGVYASEDPWLLTKVLRDEWGFDGLVVSDWGAVNDRVSALAAGLDLEMPSSGGVTDAQLVAAVRDGSLAESVLDSGAQRVIDLVQKAVDNADADASYDVDAHHALAREVAGRSIVLLKNDGVLPLAAEAGRRIAVVGEFARTPRYQGAGSSQIVPTRLDNALDEIRALAGDAEVTFAAGYTLGAEGDTAALTAEAVAAASAADDVLLFLGLPGEDESEGFDREHIELPAAQTALLEAVLAANPRVAVVLSNGGVVRVSGWADRVPAIVEGWLLGQAGGGAVADVLFGVVNPSGRLAETVIAHLGDTAASINFPGEKGHVRYGEGLFVGYRDLDAREVAVSFPFGHGLSYTTFDFGAPAVEATADGGIRVSVDVTNSGGRDGREVVQVYVALPGSAATRPVRELKGFANVAIASGATESVVIEIPSDDLAYYDTDLAGWIVEGGDYVVSVGASSRDLRGSTTVNIAGDGKALPLSVESTLGEWLSHPVGAQVLGAALAQTGDAAVAGMLADPGLRRMAEGIPLIRAIGFSGNAVSPEQLDQLVAAANA
ncbi:glycoside hydrolase family 3 C-terminal domain-containing protein [Leifsonia naganoensis]|uniref:Exo-alpha-(1->6)-L-arabinopyranosidase n=1 Tax=Leifsonia naganoensis TaxID=150025 RepID=A0A853DKZ5_9MICO|nr:glycoside hydrolase family 3 C-terminal domain-containing protein [Leifsonia naganoensis]NYK09912.1 beta-glucosidase [Leifsonia naganoensis]